LDIQDGRSATSGEGLGDFCSQPDGFKAPQKLKYCIENMKAINVIIQDGRSATSGEGLGDFCSQPGGFKAPQKLKYCIENMKAINVIINFYRLVTLAFSDRTHYVSNTKS